MLENRSFDHMLGFLYADSGNVSQAGQPFEGLNGSESNPDAAGQPVTVFRIEPSTQSAYFMPGADPGEGYMATNNQLFGAEAGPADGTVPACQGFVKDFGYTLGWENADKWPIVAGTSASSIMGCFATETLPNRAFACAATSQGHMDDKTRTFTSPSIFGLLGRHGLNWAIYGYDA